MRFHIFDKPNQDELNPRLIRAAADGDMGRYQLLVYLGASTVSDNGEALKRAAAADHASIVRQILYPGRIIHSGFPDYRVARGVDRLADAAEIAMQTAIDAGHKPSKVVSAVLDELKHAKGMTPVHLYQFRDHIDQVTAKFAEWRQPQEADHDRFVQNLSKGLGTFRLMERRELQLLGVYPASGVMANLAVTYSTIIDTKNLGLEQTFLDHAEAIYSQPFDKGFRGRGDLQKNFSRWALAAGEGKDAAVVAVLREEYRAGMEHYIQSNLTKTEQDNVRRTFDNFKGEIDMHLKSPPPAPGRTLGLG